MKHEARRASSSRGLDFLRTRKQTVRSQFAVKSEALARYINGFIKSGNYKQKELAEKLEMHESQLSKWLSGIHNLTLNSILKLESASDIKILNPEIWQNNVSFGKELTVASLDEASSELPMAPVIPLKPFYNTSILAHAN